MLLQQRAADSPGAAAAPQPVHAAAWDLRMLRAVPFAVVCTLVAAVGHAVASGGPVPVAALAVGFAMVFAVAALLGGRERSMTAISGGLAAGQLALHCLFHGAQGLGGSAMPHTGMAGMADGRLTVLQVAGRLLCNGHSPGGALVLPPGMTPEQLVARAGLDPAAFAPAPELSCLHAGVLGMTPLMLVGHLAAALAAGWWLRRGEAALWRLVRLTASTVQGCAAPLRTVLAVAGLLLRGLLGAGSMGPPRVYGPERGGLRPPVPATLRHSVVRRGPPMAALAI
ncbi:hypothetical protein ACIQGZ_01940 [Streptomyces sp. NPDC092296]|uniref:hypothetical protein n=1 Tax=Streptomyces sp. NPDC092296 TaxID=3366012 RepID=UPI00381A0EFB